MPTTYNSWISTGAETPPVTVTIAPQADDVLIAWAMNDQSGTTINVSTSGFSRESTAIVITADTANCAPANTTSPRLSLGWK